jgi:glycosyltransferase involved in cell wall biosynthesis
MFRLLNSLRDSITANDIEYGKSVEILDHELVAWADVIHCHNLHGNYFKLDSIVKLSINKKVVWTWHDWWPVTGHCATPMGCKRYESGCGECPNLKTYQTFLWDNTASMWEQKRNIYKQSKIKIVVPSKDMEVKVKQLGFDVEKIFNGVLVGKTVSEKKQLKRLLGLPQNKKIIMFVAYGWKNIDKGWGYVEQLREKFGECYWLGVGSTKVGLIDDINYVGMVEQKLMQKYMKASDVFLFPSLAESFGMTPVEAMLTGTPVVAFPVGVIPELVHHQKNGYISKYADVVDLRKGIDFVLKNKMSKLKGSQFGVAKMVNDYEKIYETA